MKAAAIAAIFTVGFGAGMWATAHARQASSLPAERVSGIGGVFFKARDPTSLAAWYRQALGIDIMTMPGAQFAKFPWREREDSSRVGSTAWSLFPADSKYFAPSSAPFMINYRVRNLDAMLAQLRALGVAVEPKVTDDFNGRFAWIVDPEGNKIELWEPKAGY
jgi:predicted enzyme related to lactoylglutathione lyase